MVDAFSTSWSQDQPYLFPLFNLIGKALTKVRIEEVDPAWPAQVWYSQILRMLVGKTVLLPMEQDLLLSPYLNPHPVILENRMFLTAWPVSGKVSHHRVFLKGLQSCPSSLGDPMPIQHTIHPGLSGVAGVLEDKSALGNILDFLADQFDLGLQYHYLNTLRSAILTSHSQIDSVNVGSHPIVSR